MQRYNNLTPLPHDNFVKTLTISEVSNTVIVRKPKRDGAEKAYDRLAALLDEAGVFAATRTDRAGTLIPPFLRSLTVASSM